MPEALSQKSDKKVAAARERPTDSAVGRDMEPFNPSTEVNNMRAQNTPRQRRPKTAPKQVAPANTKHLQRDKKEAADQAGIHHVAVLGYN